MSNNDNSVPLLPVVEPGPRRRNMTTGCRGGIDLEFSLTCGLYEFLLKILETALLFRVPGPVWLGPSIHVFLVISLALVGVIYLFRGYL